MNPFLWLQALPVDSAQINEVKETMNNLTSPIVPQGMNWSGMLHEWGQNAINFGIRVVLCVILFLIGREIIKFLTKQLKKILEKRQIDGVAVSLLDSLFVAILYVTLGIIIATTLGVQSVSFAALLASLGLAIGMALSGQLQNLAGGVVILLTKPFKIGDFVQAQGESGVVQKVSLFHTEIATPENKTVFVPNGILSSGVVVNFSHATSRRVDWAVSIEYNQAFEPARDLLISILERDSRILRDPEIFVGLKTLNSSTVDLAVRAWVPSDLYWDVYFDINRTIYAEFMKAGISFPFPHLTISGGLTTQTK